MPVKVGDDNGLIHRGLEVKKASQMVLNLIKLSSGSISSGAFMVPGKSGDAFAPEQ
jgi:hypothetical protein